MEMRSRSRRLKTLYLHFSGYCHVAYDDSLSRLSRDAQTITYHRVNYEDAAATNPERKLALSAKPVQLYFFAAGAAPPPGKIFSTCSCGRGMTCTETSSPTRRAAAAPASVAAFTAPTSPRTITVT